MCARRARCAPRSASPMSRRSARSTCRGRTRRLFLDRVYTNTFSTLPVGKARYGLMLRDDGFLYDDGTTWRLAENRYLMTTTTANAALVYQNLEMLLVDRLAGAEGLARLGDRPVGRRRRRGAEQPRAARRRRSTTSTSSDAALPFMGVQAGHLGGHRGAGRAALLLGRARLRGLLRLRSRARRLGAAARGGQGIFASCPTGWRRSERCASRRATSPHAEIDGRTTVHDLGLEKMFSMKKDFVGKPLALRPALTDPGRKQLVGLKSLDGKAVAGGAHLVAGADPKEPGRSQGHVTAMCFSPALEGYIALALLRARPAAARRKALRRRSAARRHMGRSRSSTPASSTRTGAACMAERLSALSHMPAAGGPGADASACRRSAPARSCRSQAWPETLETVRRVIAELLGVEAPAVGKASAAAGV